LLLKTIKDVAKEHIPFEIKLDDKVTYFPATEHSDGCKIAKLKIISPELCDLHKKLKDAVKDAGIDIDEHFTGYKPHVTLSYMEPPRKTYDREFPSGSWISKEIHLWNGDKRNVVSLGEKDLSKRAKDPLSTYKGKRDPKETPEPEGKVEGKNKHRFVIQDHKATKHHWDLRLENDDGTLHSWSIPKHHLPKKDEKLLAVSTEPHPIEYMNFSGEIPSGEYGAGTVKIVQKGTYKSIEYTNKKVLFEVSVGKAKGKWALIHTDGKNWLWMKYKGDNKEKKESNFNNISKKRGRYVF